MKHKMQKYFMVSFGILLLGVCINFNRVLAENNNVEYYIDPVNGNDDNTGMSKDNAFLTIEKVQSVIRESDQKKDIYVNLLDGIYRLNKPLKFSKEDSGKNGHSVVYRSQNKGKAIISGSIKVEHWELHDKRKKFIKRILI